MAYFKDLASCGYFSGWGSPNTFKAVGWLSRIHTYPVQRTKLSDTHFHRLLQLVEDPWQPEFYMGGHNCGLCIPGENRTRDFLFSIRNTRLVPRSLVEHDRLTLERYGLVIHFGISNLFLPGKNCIFVAPSMIVHYIDRHNYDPPAEFWQAVLDCPEMRSDGYKQALLANGPSDPKWTRVVSDS
jgi:hypothetical protein